MTHTYKFYKYQEQWFIDLPQWEGEIAELEMVAGADTMCEIFAQGSPEIWITFSEEHPNFIPLATLKFLREEEGGGVYEWEDGMFFTECEQDPLEIWLCHVTKFVFGRLPKVIYIPGINSFNTNEVNF